MCLSLILSLGILSVTGDSINPNTNKNLCNLSGYNVVAAKFGNERYFLCLKKVPIGSHLTQLTYVYLDPDLEDFESNTRFSVDNVTMASGFPLVAPSSGSAEGYIGDDGQFHGVLHMGNRTLYADPHHKDGKRSYGTYGENCFVSADSAVRQRRGFSEVMEHVKWPLIFPHIQLKSQMPVDLTKLLKIEDRPLSNTRARLCDLLLLADREFFVKDANSNLTVVVQRMAHAVNQADVIFRNSDFDGDGMPDNVGFSVKYIIVLSSNETNTRVFGDMAVSGNTVDGRNYLMRFARLRRLSEVCLGVVFSGHAFQNRTLGLSFTSLGSALRGAAGGLCDRRAYGSNFNTLAIAYATGEAEERVPEHIAALTLAHELGHSFGAQHDDSFSNPHCVGYLMGAHSTTADNPTHFEFSVCSKRMIAATLSTVSYCLYEDEKAFCGNGIVEEDEACDCGLPIRCVDRDPCCTPRTGSAEYYAEGTLHKLGCSVAPMAACHPSQGPCCTRICQYANLSEYGIDCTRLGQECSCFNSSCNCGLGGRCLADGSCHAAECAAQGLRECPCEPSGMGGKLKEAAMCGACCLLPGSGPEPTRCLAAELTARSVNYNYTMHSNWLVDYIGPNLTIKLCRYCPETTIRAWPVGSWCVTQNVVGKCTPRGVCQIDRPRFNVYPDTMHAMLMRHKSSAVRTRIATLKLIFFVVVLFLLVVK